MTDKEKILAKIEFLLNETIYEPYTDEVLGRIKSLKEMKSYIESMQDEPCNHCQGHNNKEECDTLVFGHNCPIVKKPVSNDLEEAAKNHAVERYRVTRDRELAEKCKWSFKTGAKWQKEHLWKPADGDDLPEIDKEVIVLTQKYPLKGFEYAVSFAHRPYKGKYIGKSLTTGNIETFENKTYDKGGWSIPDVKFWLDCEWPNKE